MISEFSATKEYVETLFNDEWTLTPIHFEGMDFREEGVPEWINLLYQPRSGLISSFGQTTTLTGWVHVICWADSPKKVEELADKVVEFFGQKIDRSRYKTDRFEITDQGVAPNEKFFITLSFDLMTSAGTC